MPQYTLPAGRMRSAGRRSNPPTRPEGTFVLDNPVADLSSFEFLAFYAALCIGTIVLARRYVAKSDASAALGREPLPAVFDPFEIAYLRGGANELVRYAVFDLTRNGLLELIPGERKRKSHIRRTAEAPKPAAMHPVCSIVYAFFDEPKTAEELFASNVPAAVETAFAPERARLEQRQLLATQEARAAARTARWAAFAVIVLVGGYRIAYALAMHHRNIGFTIAIMLIAAVVLFPLTRVQRLSQRGRQYVTTLRASLTGGGSAAPSPASEAFPIMVAAGGLALLAATPYDGLNQNLPPASGREWNDEQQLFGRLRRGKQRQ